MRFRSLIPAFVLTLLVGTLCAAVPATGDPVLGNSKASVRVVIYQDLECPACAALHQALVQSLLPAYGARVRFELRDFPQPDKHPWAYNAAVYARYLDTKNVKLGLAWRDYCFSHQADITPGNLLDVAARFCAPAGITAGQLAQSLSRQDLFARIRTDQALGSNDHLKWTPYIIVNGTAVPDTDVGAMVAHLRAMLDYSLRGH